jgi:hypothetical protein
MQTASRSRHGSTHTSYIHWDWWNYSHTGYELDERVSITNRDRDFSLRHCVQTESGVHPVFYLVGKVVLFLWEKRWKRETSHSLQSLRDYKMCGAIPPLLPKAQCWNTRDFFILCVCVSSSGPYINITLFCTRFCKSEYIQCCRLIQGVLKELLLIYQRWFELLGWWPEEMNFFYEYEKSMGGRDKTCCWKNLSYERLRNTRVFLFLLFFLQMKNGSFLRGRWGWRGIIKETLNISRKTHFYSTY